MLEYVGAVESTRILVEELSSNELENHVHKISKIPAKDTRYVNSPVEPYVVDNALLEVRLLPHCFLLALDRISIS